MDSSRYGTPPTDRGADSADPALSARRAESGPGLGAELRESLLLLALSAAVTAAVTVGASTALHLLG